MKVKLINEMIYEKMSVEEFLNWFNNIQEEYAWLPWFNIIAVLENDENSTDGELYSYFKEELNIESIHLIEELLDKRNYFINFEYAQHIDTE